MDAHARFRLPLFPLPVVLFPTAAMPLHVFEPRYRRMVERCLDTDRRFGLIYHDADLRGPFLCEEERVGCVAEIEDFHPLPDGRSAMVVRGLQRFSIADGIESQEPFYEALVTPYHDGPADFDVLEKDRRRTLALFEAVVRNLSATDDGLPEVDVSKEISFPLVRSIEVEPTWQQEFLELRSEARRLERLNAVFQAALDP